MASVETQNQVNASGFHEHNMLVYPDLDAFQEIYCTYAREHLEPPHNEIVLIVSHYQQMSKVREALARAGVDVDKHEREGSLLIRDSVEGYQADDSHTGVLRLVASLVEKAEREGKTGVCAFGDIGSFFLFDRMAELLKYEHGIPKKPEIKLKAFCSCHAGDYDRLSDEEKKMLADMHFRKLLAQN